MLHTTLFSQIEQLVPTLDGWCSVPKAGQLAATVLALRPKVTVEIGVFGGRSLIPMALAHQMMNSGRVYGIDPWNASSSTEEMTGENKAYWAKVDHDAVYRRFMGHVANLGLSPVVEVIRARSDCYNWPLDLPVDALHIDGSHGYNAATSDATRYGARVRVGGICFVDDISWDSHGPEQALVILQKMGFVELYRVVDGSDNWAAFQRQ